MTEKSKSIIKSVGTFLTKLLADKGGVSTKRFYSGILFISGIILAFIKGDPENVRTLIYASTALLGVGYFAERMGGSNCGGI